MLDPCWWRDGVIYHIYTRSFADSNNDGIGDLRGIIAKLDYLEDLGVDAIWLSPIYPSPDKDFGYDITNYIDIDPRFGSLADFELLLNKLHSRGMHLIMDLVVNHTSDQHPWFQQSRSSKENPRSDWYIWRDSPNNWLSVFGGSAWEYVPERGQYYLHSYLKEQPDLNWRNPEVSKAVFRIMELWLRRGVDGFRLDAFNVYFKDASFRDNPMKIGLRPYDRQKHIYDSDQPEMIWLLMEMRRIVDTFPDRYMVGETHLSTPEKAFGYCGNELLHGAFSFFTNRGDFFQPWNPSKLIDGILKREKVAGFKGWPTNVFSNHDMPRSASRYGKGENDALPKVFMTLLLTLRGTPYIYYGEEIGMRDISPRRDEILDPAGHIYWPIYKGRDGSRSPMQWSNEQNAGFSKAKPWLPIHPNWTVRNVAAQRSDPNSMLGLTRRLIQLRKERPSLQVGEFLPIAQRNKVSMAYLRRLPGELTLVAMNFSASASSLEMPRTVTNRKWNLLFSTTDRAETPDINQGTLNLAPHEACILIMSE